MMFSLSLSPDIDMKKDIEKLIAEERADIILKYAQVSISQAFKHVPCLIKSHYYYYVQCLVVRVASSSSAHNGALQSASPRRRSGSERATGTATSTTTVTEPVCGFFLNECVWVFMYLDCPGWKQSAAHNRPLKLFWMLDRCRCKNNT